MSGRATYRRGAVNGALVADLAITAAQWRAIEAPLGRRLTPPERARVVDLLALHKHLCAALAESRIDRQSLKRTLAGIARHPTAARYRDADALTQGMLDRELYCAGASLGAPDAEQLRSAAGTALDRLPVDAGGHPRDEQQDRLARAVWRLWEALGGSRVIGASATKDFASPPVRFAVALLAAAGTPRSASSVAKTLTTARER